MHCILPSSTGGQERGIVCPGRGGWLRDPLGPPLPSKTGKDKAGICDRELVTGCGAKGNQLSMKYLTQNPLEDIPMIRISEMAQRESTSLSLIIPLNEEVVELVGHHKFFHGLDHLLVAILGSASPQLQSCSFGGN